MQDILNALEALTRKHENWTKSWAQSNVQLQAQAHQLLQLIQENHAFNFQLWQAEDRARREDKGPEFVYCAKREVDRHNQERNNRMEAIDELLYLYLKPAAAQDCPVHSESPGMMIDRLSILALKDHYMSQQALRSEVDETHRRSCQEKEAIIKAQKEQLATCFNIFIKEICESKRTFRVYHQFKMYNDPTLNPQLYTARSEN